MEEELKSSEKPIEAAESTRNGKGNKKQWEQELGGEASLTRIKRDGRDFKVIAAEHFSKQAAEFFQEISKEITDPTKWYFLVEGKDSGIHECEIARKIAEERSIPIENPVFHPFQPEVIKLYLASDRAEKPLRKILIGQLAGILADARGTSNLEEVATILNVTSQEVYDGLICAGKEKIRDPEGYSARSKQTLNDLTKISNAVSAQVLDYYLRQNPTRTNIVLYLGKVHKEIVTMDVSQIPDNLKFSDEQIKDLLDRRTTREVAQVCRALGIKLRGAEEIPSALESPSPAKRAEQKTGQEPSIKTRIGEILAEMPDIPEELRTLIEKWSINLFGLEDIRSGGYKRYFDSDNSLHKIWGAAALLAEKVDAAELEDRELRPKEISEIKKAFSEAAKSRRNNSAYASQGDEIEKMAENVTTLIKIAKRLRQDVSVSPHE